LGLMIVGFHHLWGQGTTENEVGAGQSQAMCFSRDWALV
jgi:hypothetical protein